MTEDRKQRSEDRNQMTEIRRQITEKKDGYLLLVIGGCDTEY